MENKQKWATLTFNEIEIHRIGEGDNATYLLQTCRKTVFDKDKGNVKVPITKVELPLEIGEPLLRLLVEQMKFQNKVVDSIQNLLSEGQRCTYSEPHIISHCLLL